MKREFWRGKRVFLTGHTGFKGGWLALWLADMKAEVHGYALTPPTAPNLFTVTNLRSRLAGSTIADVRDADALNRAMHTAQPEVVFHMAAQSLVRYSYVAPVETYAINVMGTVNVLEAARQVASVRAVVNVTTDKCYENREWPWPYRENEAMGGFDPYSSSKACSELITAAYRRSFFETADKHLASARAGNVIGGGDWAADRLVPDFLRALDSGHPLKVRSPLSTRPWQHVLEPLSGYMLLAEKLFRGETRFADAWNFGPCEADARSVQWIVEYLGGHVADAVWHSDASPQPHEANTLRLDSSKAQAQLGWRRRWNLETALDMTLAWHVAWKQGADMAEICKQQIANYESASS
ncbi:MAG: CDP-glucose 4,6-dehydratase [Spirochaetes bacterium]|nr:CDP-glucose 4,6-dehydratase [Spirochaetota bacterium]